MQSGSRLAGNFLPGNGGQGFNELGNMTRIVADHDGGIVGSVP